MSCFTRPRGTIKEIKPVISGCHRFLWVIQDFSEVSIIYRSPTFTIKPYPNSEYSITIYPNSKIYKGSMALSIVTSKEIKCSYTYQMVCTIPSSAMDSESHILHGSRKRTHDGTLCNTSFFTREQLKDVAIDSSVKLCFDIVRYPCDTFLNLETPLKRIMFNKLTEHFGTLFESGLHSDVTLRCGDYEYKMHKSILANRSSVFAGMFDNDFDERRTGVVQVSYEFTPKAIEEMLRFMYTNETSDKFPGLAHDLLKAADYYDIKDLKTVCEHSLLENVNVENVAQTIVSANNFGLEELREYLLEFIRINHKDVMKNSQYRDLYRSDIDLILEIDDYTTSKNNELVKNSQ